MPCLKFEKTKISLLIFFGGACNSRLAFLQVDFKADKMKIVYKLVFLVDK